MTTAMRHRGPDGQGHVILNPGRASTGPIFDVPPAQDSGVFFLGHRRLAIIDPKGTIQPLHNEDGSVWTVFNGEIYNHHELRTLLEKRGHVLREKGDTEILVHLWEEFGEEMPQRLNGMFALAIYDLARDVVFLARDRFGEKPLYYWEGPGIFAFASELHALALVPGFPLDELNDRAIASYFSLGYVPHPDTIYKAAQCLPPGNVLLYGQGKSQRKCYWTPKVEGGCVQLDIEEFSTRFDEAVSSRMVSDVPVGCFLSGGLDSSLIASSMALTAAPQTFTISADDPACDESGIARRIAGHLGALHREFQVQPDFIAVAEKLAGHYGQPFADYSCIPTYYVSRETRREVKVALSGDGGDELFAGYTRYANARAAALVGLIPRPLRQLFSWGTRLHSCNFTSHFSDFILSAGSAVQKVDAPSSLFHAYWRDKVFQDTFYIRSSNAILEGQLGKRFSQSHGPDMVSRLLETDQACYLSADILTKVDIASMSVSLESRAPFLDHRFADYVNGLDISVKIAGRTGKLPLRKLAQQRLPPDVAELPKRGFTLPLAIWMRRDIREWCQSVLFDDTGPWEPYLKPVAVARLWKEHQTGKWDHAMRLWAIIAVTLWRRAEQQYKLGMPYDGHTG